MNTNSKQTKATAPTASAWNGRNVGILGAKARINDKPSLAISSREDTANSLSNDQAEVAEEAKNVSTVPASIVPSSVWNGRHQKIIDLREPSKGNITSDASSVASYSKNPSSHVSPTFSAASAILSKKEELVVISPQPKVDTKSVQQLQLKEDEATSSTAGSSITNTTIGEDSTLEEVTTTVSPESEKKTSSNHSTATGINRNASAAAVTKNSQRRHNRTDGFSSTVNAINVNPRQNELGNNKKDGRRSRNSYNELGKGNNNGRLTHQGNSKSERRRGEQ